MITVGIIVKIEGSSVEVVLQEENIQVKARYLNHLELNVGDEVVVAWSNSGKIVLGVV